MPFGLLSTGFNAKTLEDIRSEISDDIHTNVAASMNTTDKSRIGKLIGVFANQLAQAWEGIRDVFDSFNPDAATGLGLARLAALTGTIKNGASKSQVTLTLTGEAGSAVPTTGARFAVTSTSSEFKTIEGTGEVFGAVTAWSGAEILVAGDRRYSTVSTIRRVYECVVGGTTHASVAPTGETGSVTDGTATLAYVGRGNGVIDLDAEAVISGPISAVARDLTTILTPSHDLFSVINLENAIVGQDVETDEALRVRREDEIAQLGSTPVDAIRAELLQVPNVTTVSVFPNNSDVEDADGVPPHSVEPLVEGGVDQAIWNALLASVAAGIATHGDVVGAATDSVGNSHVMKFSRPDEEEIYVTVTLKKDATYPSNGDDQVKARIVELGNALGSGKNVVSTQIARWVYDVTGVHDVDPPLIGTSPSPVSQTTLTITSRQIPKFALARIVVNSSTAVP